MSDYISIQEAIDRLSEVLSSEAEFEKAKQVIIEAPTLDEKEIIRKPMERIIERLEEERKYSYENFKDEERAWRKGLRTAIKIVKEEGGIDGIHHN